MKVTREEYEALEKELQGLKAKLEQCEIEGFGTKGEWFIGSYGDVNQGSGSTPSIKGHYNYWKDEEMSKVASKMQRRHNAIMNYVSQKQQLGEGDYSVYKNGLHNWVIGTNFNTYYPDAVLMLESTAEQMVKDINSGYFPLKKLIEEAG